VKKVERSELLDLGAYEQIRERFRARIIADKKARRFEPTGELSIVFENHDTVLFQIQEMLRTERITKEAAVKHELDTYNELVPGEGELSATLFIEIADRDTRERRLVELAGLESCFALDVGGSPVAARNETRGVLPDRTTAVHYLKFPLGVALAARLQALAADPATPESAVALVISHPQLTTRAPLPAPMLRALADDLMN
jgi:hypothetical protein